MSVTDQFPLDHGLFAALTALSSDGKPASVASRIGTPSRAGQAVIAVSDGSAVRVACIDCGLVQENPTPIRAKPIDGIDYGVTRCVLCGGIWARAVL